MSADLRQYLIERFRSDAHTLRERATALAAATKPVAGPDASMSLGMADACEQVAMLAESLPVSASLPDMLAALNALLPTLAERANSSTLAKAPPIRSVYAGAATRIKELIAVESRAANEGDGLSQTEVGDVEEGTDEDVDEDLDADMDESTDESTEDDGNGDNHE